MSTIIPTQGIQVYDGGTVPVPSPPGVSTLTTRAGSLFITAPGSSSPSQVGGGSGTIHVGSGLQGDGSVGTPADLSAANKATLASVASGWAQIEATAIAAVIPGITQFKPIHVGQLAPITGTQAATDPATEGGAIFANNASLVTFFGQSVFQTPHTGKWSISFLGKLLGNGASGHDCLFGVSNAAGTHSYAVGWQNAASATKFCLAIFGGTTTPLQVPGTLNGDSNIHVFRLMYDGTTVSLAIDGNIVATTTTTAGLIDEPLYPELYSATVKQAILVDCLVGFVPA